MKPDYGPRNARDRPVQEKLLAKAKCQIAVYRSPGDLSAQPSPGIIAPRRSSSAPSSSAVTRKGAGLIPPLVVGISGATGIIYGIRALQMLRELGIETHLVVSDVTSPAGDLQGSAIAIR